MAYTTATCLSKEPVGDTVRIIVGFTGDAGEPEVRREYIITATTTIADIRQWAYRLAQTLGPLRTVADLITQGASITLTAPPAPPAPTAFAIWLEKAQRLSRMKAFSVTSVAATTDTSALQTDVNDTYQAGFITDV